MLEESVASMNKNFEENIQHEFSTQRNYRTDLRRKLYLDIQGLNIFLPYTFLKKFLCETKEK